jgi:hypothetical protein
MSKQINENERLHFGCEKEIKKREANFIIIYSFCE